MIITGFLFNKLFSRKRELDLFWEMDRIHKGRKTNSKFWNVPCLVKN